MFAHRLDIVGLARPEGCQPSFAFRAEASWDAGTVPFRVFSCDFVATKLKAQTTSHK